MKQVSRLLCVLLCLCTVLSLAPAVSAQTDDFEYGPALESPLNKEEKLELMAALYDADVTSVVTALREGLISCQELTAFYLNRIEEYEDPYNCLITVCDNAMEEAKKRDAELVAGTADGSLHGLPIMVKDNIKYKGYYTTNGIPKSQSKIATSNAFIVQNLLKEGVVILAKTNMCEWAQSASHSTSRAGGITKNAYNTYMAPGGSSGGSAVATSLNLCMAALGTDTNSSLRMPSALNGCVSMRVTHGTISRSGITTLNSTRDVPGVITRSVEDLALMLDQLSGKTQYLENLNGNALEGARIGIIKQLAGPTAYYGRSSKYVDKEVVAAFQNAVKELESCGAEVVEISLSSIFSGGRETLYKTYKSQLAQYDLDAVIYPTYLSTPQKVGKDANGKYWSTYGQTWINNCHFLSPATGCPEITVIIGKHSRGPSIGMEIAALKNQEQLLLDLAYSYTLRYDHRITPTGAPNDYLENRTVDLKTLVANYQEKKNPTWTYDTNENGVTITACNDAESTAITVPAALNGQPVIAIGENAFANCAKAELVQIPSGLQSIHTNAFSGSKVKQIGFAGSKEAWDAFGVSVSITPVCDYQIPNDFTGDLAVDENDAVYLLRNSLFGEDFALENAPDYNGDGAVSCADAMRIYWHSQNPDRICLTEANQ